jgi:hypothetical protein
MNVADVEVHCPLCWSVFRVSAGFVRHMVMDHWCESDLAAASWREGLLH